MSGIDPKKHNRRNGTCSGSSLLLRYAVLRRPCGPGPSPSQSPTATVFYRSMFYGEGDRHRPPCIRCLTSHTGMHNGLTHGPVRRQDTLKRGRAGSAASPEVDSSGNVLQPADVASPALASLSAVAACRLDMPTYRMGCNGSDRRGDANCRILARRA